MAVSEDRKFTKEQVYNLLEGAKGKTLGEVDKSHQFARTLESKKITGIAGDVIEQSVFGYKKDSKQECDIEIDGVLTEVKTTGVRVPKRDQKNANGKTGEAYNVYLGAKEGISITHVTFEPPIQTDFDTSHFWEKTERLLIIFYEYKSYEVVPASGYAKFPIVDYCYNSFSQEEKDKLQNDWEIVSSHLQQVYHDYQDAEKRNEQLVGFTHLLRPNLLLMRSKILETYGALSATTTMKLGTGSKTDKLKQLSAVVGYSSDNAFDLVVKFRNYGEYTCNENIIAKYPMNEIVISNYKEYMTPEIETSDFDLTKWLDEVFYKVKERKDDKEIPTKPKR
nr:MAG TPA: hypothetical protein [Caudoviricetes sp.]